MTWKPKDSYCSVDVCLCPACGNDLDKTLPLVAEQWEKYKVTCDSCGTTLQVAEELRMYYHVQKCEIGI